MPASRREMMDSQKLQRVQQWSVKMHTVIVIKIVEILIVFVFPEACLDTYKKIKTPDAMKSWSTPSNMHLTGI